MSLHTSGQLGISLQSVKSSSIRTHHHLFVDYIMYYINLQLAAVA